MKLSLQILPGILSLTFSSRANHLLWKHFCGMRATDLNLILDSVGRSALVAPVPQDELRKYRPVTLSAFRLRESNSIAWAHDTRAFGPDRGGPHHLVRDDRSRADHLSRRSTYHNFASTRREESSC
jgi:hypothetical protein